MISKASKQLNSGKITINDRDVSTELLVRLYNIAKRYGVGYFSSNTMPIDGNGANPLRAVYYAARLLELPKPILYCV